MFPSLRVDVLDPVSILPVHVEGDGVAAEKVQQQETVVVYLTHPSNKWDHLGAKIATSSAPLSSDAEVKLAVSALGKREFLEKRQGFDLLSFFKNPMILMGVLSMGLVFGMPYLMDNSEFYNLLPPISSSPYTTSPSPSLLENNLLIYHVSSFTVDEETKAEFAEMQKQGPLGGAGGSAGAAQAVQNFDLAGWMAGKSDPGAAKK